MARLTQAAKAKRDRERLRGEYKQEKQEKRAQRTEAQRQERERLQRLGIDPDLAGIRPGPQPLSLPENE